MLTTDQKFTGLEIAVIGMSCRFPGASDCNKFWKNLVDGVESVRYFTDAELAALGMDAATTGAPGFVKADVSIEDKDCFDASFFNYIPDEARLMNPENRIFHECVWAALEDAGYASDKPKHPIGLYAGGQDDLNWRLYSSISNTEGLVDAFTLGHINNKDHLTTLISYKLNLKGPSFSLYTGCSTSLVAVHLACRAILLGETKMAVAGGVSIKSNAEYGYNYRHGSIFSQDGHCRAFDHDATGTISGEGAGVVVLKRLKEALNDGDNIHAVIKGSAINNDGIGKVGYTAPSVEGQSECIRMAHTVAKVDPASVTYVEAHGTATKLGDPIEVEALNRAFGNNTGFCCRLGSVKSNIGHLGSAAGIAGLLKTVLSLKYKKIPKSLHFNKANPHINFSQGPFSVNTELTNWEPYNHLPLRAGVSSFGIGGTNAHVVLEETPETNGSAPTDAGPHLFIVSAKTEASLIRQIDAFGSFLTDHAGINLHDLSFTLQAGRAAFHHRFSVAFTTREELIGVIQLQNWKYQLKKSRDTRHSVVFMFSGAGSQYAHMGKGLYDGNAFFRQEMDNGFALLEKLTATDYKEILYPAFLHDTRVNNMLHTQPVIFLFEYALARLLMHWGIRPAYLIGHSIGEYVAACISGVFSFEDALMLVVSRGTLMNRMPPGAMISASICEKDALPFVSAHISLAAVNSPGQVVFSGEASAAERLMDSLNSQNITAVKLVSSHAGHSPTTDAILDDYRTALEKVTFHSPQIPFISGTTGSLIETEQARSLHYWVRHMRETVQFSKGVQTLVHAAPQMLCIEVGGGHSLTSLLKQHAPQNITAINLVRHPKEKHDDLYYLTTRLAQLWSHGVEINWAAYHHGKSLRRISLPTYSFEKDRYLAEVSSYRLLAGRPAPVAANSNKTTDWYYKVQWKQSYWLPETGQKPDDNVVMLLHASQGLAQQVKERYLGKGIRCITVETGACYLQYDAFRYVFNPACTGHYRQLFGDVRESGLRLSAIVHLLNCAEDAGTAESCDNLLYYQVIGYESLLETAKNFSFFNGSASVAIHMVGSGWYSVLGTEHITPAKATALGAVKVVPLEFPGIRCSAIDVSGATEGSIDPLMRELLYHSNEKEVAIRGRNRYVKDFEKIIAPFPEDMGAIRQHGTYLITGANGGMGSMFANFLATFETNLILVGRQAEPAGLISALQQKGATVHYIQSDVADAHTMIDGITKAGMLFGQVNGVIHAAGSPDFGGIILKRTRKDDEKIFAAKLSGTALLYNVFRQSPLDFFVNCSSLSASKAPFGQVAYAAANLYLDAFAEANNRSFPVISIQWCRLAGIGMGAITNNILKPQENSGSTKGISAKDAVAVLLGALFLKMPVQIISLTDFKQDHDGYYLNNYPHQLEINAPQPVVLKERPQLSMPYQVPSTALEKKITGIWETFFGLTGVGVEDNFFEMGGDSLRALIVCKRMHESLNVDVSLADFFHQPTIKGIANRITALNNAVPAKMNSIII